MSFWRNLKKYVKSYQFQGSLRLPYKATGVSVHQEIAAQLLADKCFTAIVDPLVEEHESDFGIANAQVKGSEPCAGPSRNAFWTTIQSFRRPWLSLLLVQSQQDRLSGVIFTMYRLVEAFPFMFTESAWKELPAAEDIHGCTVHIAPFLLDRYLIHSN